MNIKHIKMALGFVGKKMPKIQYNNYKRVLKTSEEMFNKTSTTRFSFHPTENRIANFYGAGTELNSILQSSEFIDTIFSLLKKKGYRIARTAILSEEHVPIVSGIGGKCVVDQMCFNPRCINLIEPRTIFHETGHLLHDKLHKGGGIVYNFFSKKDKHIPFLSKKELDIFKQDIRRATKEGYFRGLPFKHWTKDKLFGFGEISNRDIRNYRKHAAEKNAIGPLTNRWEFVADIFSLKIQGFKFSPEIEVAYKKFGGYEVKETFSKEEIDNLLKLQKQIRKKSLSDYGISFVS